MSTQTIVLYVVAGVLALVYMFRRRNRLNSEE